MTPPTDHADAGFGFAGAVVLVACGSAALGSAVARYLSARGAVVVAHHDDPVQAELVASNLAGAGGTDAEVVTGSVATPDACRELVSSITVRHGRIDAVVNGLAAGPGYSADASGTGASSSVEYGLTRTIDLTRAVLPEITRCRAGRLVHVTSGIGAFGLTGHAVQSSIDAGIVGYSNALALELDQSDTRVNSVAPILEGPNAQALFAMNPGITASHYSAAAVASPIAYLCHPACTLNGVALSAGGGRVARTFMSTSIGHMLAGFDLTEIDEKIGQILAEEHSVMPASVHDELLLLEV